MVNSFSFDEVNNHWFVNKVYTMLALFYPAVSNLCYPFSENVPGTVCQVPFHRKKKKIRFLFFTQDHKANKYSRVRTNMLTPT